MGWESRRKHRYYYSKRRHGGRVVSEYHGAGNEAAAYAAMLAKRRLSNERRRQEQRVIVDIDQEIADFAQMVLTIAGAVLVAAGYHRHKREWRLQHDSADREA